MTDTGAVRRFVCRTAGTKVARHLHRMREAHAAGLWVELVYVRSSEAKARSRITLRRRGLPAEVFREYARKVPTALAIEQPLASGFVQVDNEEDRRVTRRSRSREKNR